MRLQALQIYRIPGITEPFRVDPAGDASVINLVTGENAAGKTSLLRAVRGALYDQSHSDHRYALWAQFVDDDGHTLNVENNGGRSHWSRDGEPVERPPLPDERFVDCYLLAFEDLSAVESQSEAALAARIGRELTGGYDLGKAREVFDWHRQRATRPAKDLATAERALHQVRQEQAGLRDDEQHLADLEAQREAAQAAARELDRVQQAQAYADIREQRRAVEQELAAMPPDMHRLSGDDLDQLKALDRQRQREQQAKEQAEQDREQARADLAATGLQDSPVDREALGEPGGWIDRLHDRQIELEHERERLEAAETALAARRAHLGGPPEAEPEPINADTVRQATRALGQLREHDARIRELQHARDRLPGADEEVEPVETLREARNALRQWLGAAAADEHAGRRWIDWLWLGIPLALAAVAAAVVIHWSYLVLLLGAVPVLWRGFRRDARQGAGAARERFEATGLDPPPLWERGAVEAALDDLEARIVRAERHTERVEERRDCERALDAAREEREHLVGALEQTAGGLGFDPQQLDEGLLAWLDAVVAYRDGRIARDQHAARVQSLEMEIAGLRRNLVAFLTDYDEAPDRPEPSVETLRRALNGLQGRIQARDDANAAVHDAERRIREARERLEAVDGQRKRFFEARNLAVDDLDTLHERVRHLDRWRELRDTYTKATARENQAREPLDAAERTDLVELADQGLHHELEQRRAAAERSAEEAETIRQRIADIRAKIQREKEDRRLEAAEAEVQRARDTLADELDEACRRAAGAMLLHEVEQEVQAVERPRMLAQAQDWFRAFTGYQYELDVAPGEEARFVARETATGERRELRELSSGTRMQLLLAVRLGFAIHAEADRGRLPLFLDEALATTDPRRFREVAKALQLIAQEDGRQIFYLTADPAERAHWQQALGDDAIHVIDVSEIRTAAAALAAPETLLHEPTAPLPSPDEVGEDAFLQRLGVPPLDPWRGVDAVHLFYLLGDWLAMLHRLARAGIVRVGPLRAMLQGHALEAELDDSERELLEARIAGARTWITAWREGRGHPVDRTVLAESPMSESRQFEDVVAQIDRYGHDAETFIAALRGKAVAELRRSRIDQLEEYLREHDYLPDREPLSAEAIHQRVLEIFHAYLPFEQAGDEAQRLERRLEAGIEAAARPAAAG